MTHTRKLAALFAIIATLAVALAACAGAPTPTAAEQTVPTQPPMVEPYVAPTGATAGDAYPTAPAPTPAPADAAYPTAPAPADAAPTTYPTPEQDSDQPSGPVTLPPQSPGDDLPADAVLRMRRSGGIGGSADVWTLYADGRLELSQRDAPARPLATLPKDQVDGLLADLERSGFFNLKAAYGDPNACCDMIFVTLEARSGGKIQRVTYNASTGDVPPELTAAAAAFQALIKSTQ